MSKDDSIAQSSRKDVLANILLFGWNWQVNLSRRLKNAEMIGAYPNKKECLNYILNCLVNSYVENTIELILNQFYQVVKLIQKYDANFRYVPNESDPVGLLMEYRNKLVAHAIENKISGESDKYVQLLKTWPRIFRDIEAGVEKVFEWMHSLKDVDHNLTAKLHPAFELEHFTELLKVSPDRVALEDVPPLLMRDPASYPQWRVKL
jgi:hypothetical protein